MKFSNYIKSLRNVITNILDGVNDEKRGEDNDILWNNDIISARWVLERTKDFENFEVNRHRELILNHIQWLEDNFSDGEQEMQAVQALRDVFEIKQTHVISEKDNMLYLDDRLLIVHHKSGDVDTIDARKPHMQHLVASLYDLYQSSDTIHAGDQFSLNGKIVAKCVDVHVVAVQETAVVLLNNYTFMPEDIAMLDRDFKVQIVDDTGGAHHVIYRGAPSDLKKMIKKYWPDHFENEGDMDAAIGDWPYIASWGEGYASPSTRLVPQSFFSEDNGYETQHQDAIQQMTPGSTLDLTGLSGEHYIKRLY